MFVAVGDPVYGSAYCANRFMAQSISPTNRWLGLLRQPIHGSVYLTNLLYFLNTSLTLSCGNAWAVLPFSPFIVSAATSALTIASSVACAVAQKSGLMRSFGSIDRFATPLSLLASFALAVENAMKI